jgi:hypothetical protein
MRIEDDYKGSYIGRKRNNLPLDFLKYQKSNPRNAIRLGELGTGRHCDLKRVRSHLSKNKRKD